MTKDRWLAISYGTACLLTVTLGYFLLRVPIQTSDCFTNMLVLGDRFMEVMQRGIQPGYLRPGLWAQLKVVYDLSGGEYFYWFRWTQVVQVLCILLPFAAFLQPRTRTGAIAFAMALMVLIGHHAFAWTLREAYPVNAYTTNVIACLVVAMLAFGEYRWWKDVAAVAIFLLAVLSVESGLLAGGILLVCYALGLRGVSWRGMIVVAAAIVAYFVIRFVVLKTGTPSLLDRESSVGFERYSGVELSRMFAGRVYVFYAYNVVTSLIGTLFAEPRDGAFRLTKSVLAGSPDPKFVIGVMSSTLSTALIARYIWVRRGYWRRWQLDRDDRIVILFVLVLLANAAISFAYTKDVIMSPAGLFYAAAFFVGLRHYLDGLAIAGQSAVGMSRLGLLAAVALVLVLSSTWTIRAVGLHAALTQTAYKVREQWAYFDDWVERNYQPVPAPVRQLKTHLQNDAVIAHPGAMEMRERWTPLFEMD